mmetsp:Transcript_3475/g.4430  ORF Transcript_3475/g.4430 Transcript_3475/m.4430 type:complete len:101 (+) Transcript_3475:228-530(+)
MTGDAGTIADLKIGDEAIMEDDNEIDLENRKKKAVAVNDSVRALDSVTVDDGLTHISSKEATKDDHDVVFNAPNHEHQQQQQQPYDDMMANAPIVMISQN